VSALGRAAELGTLELPRGEAARMQVIAIEPDLDAVSVEFDLKLALCLPDELPTEGTRLISASSAVCPTRLLGRQPATAECFTSHPAQRGLVGIRDLRNRTGIAGPTPVPRPAALCS